MKTISFALFISLLLGFTMQASAQSLAQALQPFLGLEGRGQVFYAKKEKGTVGSCGVSIKNYQTYNAVSLNFATAYPATVIDSQVENVISYKHGLTFEMSPTGDYTGELCGNFAKAKKVFYKMSIADKRIEIQRTYRCPYFMTSTVDTWICHY